MRSKQHSHSLTTTTSRLHLCVSYCTLLTLCFICMAVVVILKVAVKFVDPYSHQILVYNYIWFYQCTFNNIMFYIMNLSPNLLYVLEINIYLLAFVYLCMSLCLCLFMALCVWRPDKISKVMSWYLNKCSIYIIFKIGWWKVQYILYLLYVLEI